MSKLQPPPAESDTPIIPISNPNVTETSTSELARPVVFKDTEYAATKKDGDWILALIEKGEYRHLSEDEAKKVASIMNEQGSNVITLYCRSEKCKYKGTWIKRSSEDAKKNVYFCEGCKQGLTR